MNKQEQIEKIDEVLSDSLYYNLDDDGRPYYEFDKFEVVDNLIKAGYINGADFVEWLKKNFIVATWDRKGNKVKLAEALQEYTKGE